MKTLATYQDKSDEALVQLVLQDKENYLYLMQRYESKLLRFLSGIASLDRQEYEDILQNAFLKAYINLRDFDISLKFSSWIYRIVHNEMIDYLRKNKRAGGVISLEADSEDALKLSDILADETNLPQEMDRTILREKMIGLLQDLPVDYREVIILRYFEDKDYEAISDILKKPMGTVATLLNRAKAKLKEKITSSFRM